MPLHLEVADLPPGACRAFRHHVHAEVTRAPRLSDPRVPGRSRHEDVSVTRTLDHLTPHLLRWCAEGALLPGVVLRLTRPPVHDVPERPYFRIELLDVLVTSVLTSLEDDGPLETVTFDYGAVRWVYEGSEGPPATTDWRVHGA